jgi:predicted nucleotidyltransferase
MASTDPKLTEIIKILSAEFKPSKIYLFGSRGRGDHRSDSDYDLILVDAQSSLPVIERMMRASEILRQLGVTADVFFYSKETFDDWKDEFSSIPELAIREGQELILG